MTDVYTRSATLKIHILIQRREAVYHACSQSFVNCARQPYLFTSQTRDCLGLNSEVPLCLAEGEIS